MIVYEDSLKAMGKEDGVFHRRSEDESTPPPELPLTPAHLGNMGEDED